MEFLVSLCRESSPSNLIYCPHQDVHRFAGADLAKSVVVFKERVLTIIDEYFASDDVKEVAAALEELEVPGFHHHFVKKLVSR